MRKMRRLAIICLAVLMVLTAFPGAAEVSALPYVLAVQYLSPGNSPQIYALPYGFQQEGSWLWLTLPEDVPLDRLLPMCIPQTDGALWFYTPDRIAATELDFSLSETQPILFHLEDSEGTVLWEGYLTVSHIQCPDDLPPVPPTATESASGGELILIPLISDEEPTPAPTEPVLQLILVEPEQATAAPTLVPTAEATQAPAKPTAEPTPSPLTTPEEPEQQVGYARVQASPANLRTAPGGRTLAQVNQDEVVYVTGQVLDIAKIVWHRVVVESTGAEGMIRADQLHVMDDQEVTAYLGESIAAPTATPEPVPTLALQITTEATMEPTAEPTAAPTLELIQAPTQEPTQVSTQEPTPVPTPAPTLTPLPTQPPTQVPTLVLSKPTAIPTAYPAARNGYGMVQGSPVYLRGEPNGASLLELANGQIVFVSGQAYDADGVAWHRVTMDYTTTAGYVRSDFVRFLSDAEVAAYFATPAPATQAPVVSTIGYARANYSGVPVYSVPNYAVSSFYALSRGDALYIYSQLSDYQGNWWYYIQSGGVFGYIPMMDVTLMTAAETEAYLKSLRQKPSATEAPLPTLNPVESYAVVKKDNVNFRDKPAGKTVLRRVDTGVVARLLQPDPVFEKDYNWYYVQIGDKVGYLREDVIDLIHIKPPAVPTPTPVPTPVATPTPPPTPSPSPSPAATPRAKSVLEHVLDALDTQRYAAYALEQLNILAYAIDDWDMDGRLELVTVEEEVTRAGNQNLWLTAYRMECGMVTRVAEEQIDYLAVPDTALQLDRFTQDSIDVLYLEQYRLSARYRSALSEKVFALTAEGWAEVEKSAVATNRLDIWVARINAAGVLEPERMEHPVAMPEPAPSQSVTLSPIFLRIMEKVLEAIAVGNG